MRERSARFFPVHSNFFTGTWKIRQRPWARTSRSAECSGKCGMKYSRTSSGNSADGDESVAGTTDRRRVSWHRVAGGNGDWIGNHGRAAGRGERGDRTAGEYDCDGSGAGGVNTRVWADFRSAFQSRGDGGGRDGRWGPVGRGASLRVRPSSGRRGRGGGCELDVRTADCFDFATCAGRRRAIAQRIHRNVWIVVGNLGMFAFAVERDRVCGGSLHYGGVLVHGVDFICESGG